MKVSVRTPVRQDYRTVWKAFDESLFRKLAPVYPRMQVLRFDGCHRGDEVQVVLNFGLFSQEWHSITTEDGALPQELYFVDRGTLLPFFLTRWEHRHRIVKSGSGTAIIDEIDFKTPVWLPEVLVWPVIYLQFRGRRPVYKREFNA